MKTATSHSSSVVVGTRSMAKKLQASSETISTLQTIEKILASLVNTSADVEGSKRETLQPTPRSTPSYLEVAFVMTTNAAAMEEQITSLAKAIEVAKLINEMHKADASQIVDNPIDAQDEVETPTKQQPVENEKSPHQELQVSPEGRIHVDQVMMLISGTIKHTLDGSSKSPSTYVKPYTQRIDDLKMPMGYIPPKFQQFDGKGNPKQHLAHFVETCNDAGTYGEHLINKFIRSPKENAFDCWKHLEEEFLNRFYSTPRTKDPVIDYINRWRNLSLNCKDRLAETSNIELCIQGMQWGLRHILQRIQPKSFEDIHANKIKEPSIQKSYQLHEEHVEEEQEDHEDGGKSFDETSPYAI
ncbi:hypothetical protein ABFS83_09G047400 [Erythranthe nasuta]